MSQNSKVESASAGDPTIAKITGCTQNSMRKSYNRADVCYYRWEEVSSSKQHCEPVDLRQICMTWELTTKRSRAFSDMRTLPLPRDRISRLWTHSRSGAMLQLQRAIEERSLPSGE